jgi:hypothetical protein
VEGGHTYGHVEQLAGSHDGKQAVYVVKDAKEDLRLGGGCGLQ